MDIIYTIDWSSYYYDFLEILFSQTAIIIYVIFILILVIVIIISIMTLEAKKSELPIEEKEEPTIEIEEVLEVEEEIESEEIVSEEIVPEEIVPEEIVPEEIVPEELEKKIEIEEKKESRFRVLSVLDEELKEYQTPKYIKGFTLKKMCENFRMFSSGKMKLYYDISDIRRFIAGLSVTKIIILQGMSGTGKTSLAYAFGEYLNNDTTVISIQPMWKERTDMLGYFNEFTNKFSETMLLKKMYEANYKGDIYVTVLDEMNIARVEYYFADFLSLLELPDLDKRNIEVVSRTINGDPKLFKDGKLEMPRNMWFIGTANNDDSTFAISDKVYDRAIILNLDHKANPFISNVKEGQSVSIEQLEDMFNAAKRKYAITDRSLRKIRKLDEYMINQFQLTFGNRIMNQLNCYVPVFVACGGSELSAIDDILSTKIIRKLESQNPINFKKESTKLIEKIDELFGINVMELCIKNIKRIARNG